MNIENTNKTYYTNGHTKWSCQYHVIFCPKYRRPVLINGVDIRLKELLTELSKRLNFNIIEVEVMPDHVHLLLEVNPDIGIKTIISQIKGNTSNILRNEFPELKSKLPCLWTRGKFISTVGAVSLDVVKAYIENQKGI